MFLSVLDLCLCCPLAHWMAHSDPGKTPVSGTFLVLDNKIECYDSPASERAHVAMGQRYVNC